MSTSGSVVSERAVDERVRAWDRQRGVWNCDRKAWNVWKVCREWKSNSDATFGLNRVIYSIIP